MEQNLTFADLGLSEEILQALEKKGYGYPTRIQAEAIPEFLQQALSLLEQWGLQPEQLQKVIERTHVFTHVEWHMRCCYVRVAEPGGDFTWVDGAEFSRSIALPTAFRMFWEPEDGQAEK